MSIKQNTTNLQSVLDAVNALPEAGSGLDTSDATAAATDIRSGKTAYVDGEKVTGTLAVVTQATPSISLSTSGLITASASQTGGIVNAGTKSATRQLTVQAAKAITPGTSYQTAVASGVYTTGAVTVQGDANLIPENIAEGVSIFGVEGTHSGGSGGGNTVSITAEYIGTTAYYFDKDGNQTQLGAYMSHDIVGGILFVPYAPNGVIVNSTADYTVVNEVNTFFICIKGDATVSIEEDW